MPEIWQYTSTETADTETADTPKKPKLKAKLRFYRNAILWKWKHRSEPNNRHKMRRMMREVQE